MPTFRLHDFIVLGAEIRVADLCVWVRARARVCVGVCVRARVCVCLSLSLSLSVFACVCVHARRGGMRDRESRHGRQRGGGEERYVTRDLYEGT